MLQIAMLVFGVVILFTGRMKMSGKILEGSGARLLGLLMCSPLPISFIIGLLYGISQAAQGRTAEDIRQEAFGGPLFLMEIGIVIGMGALVLVLFHVFAKPIEAPDYSQPPVMPPLGPPKQTDNPYEPPANPFGDR